MSQRKARLWVQLSLTTDGTVCREVSSADWQVSSPYPSPDASLDPIGAIEEPGADKPAGSRLARRTRPIHRRMRRVLDGLVLLYGNWLPSRKEISDFSLGSVSGGPDLTYLHLSGASRRLLNRGNMGFCSDFGLNRSNRLPYSFNCTFSRSQGHTWLGMRNPVSR